MDPRLPSSDLTAVIGVSYDAIEFGAATSKGGYCFQPIMNEAAACPFKGAAHGGKGGVMYLMKRPDGSVSLKCHAKKHGCDKHERVLLQGCASGDFPFIVDPHHS